MNLDSKSIEEKAIEISRNYKKRLVDERLLGFMSLDLGALGEEMGKISGNWNGKDDKFIVEDRLYPEEAAHCADEIVGLCNKLQELLEEMAQY